jgi:hypothetical protein
MLHDGEVDGNIGCRRECRRVDLERGIAGLRCQRLHRAQRFQTVGAWRAKDARMLPA